MRGSPLTDFILINSSIAVMLLLFTQGYFSQIEMEMLRYFPYSIARYLNPILIAVIGGAGVGVCVAWAWRKLFGS